MAGIGFELKKLFQKKGVINTTKAYGYATVICAGPMLLGQLLLLGIMSLCQFFEVAVHTRELLISMITYTLLASVMVSAFFSMVVTRYVADMLFSDQYEAVLPAFWGSAVVQLAVGSPMYGIFLLFSGASFLQGFLCYILFTELIIAWSGMSFLSAIKEYRGIFLSFFTSVVTAILLGAVFLWLAFPVIEALLLAVSIGYGMMMIWDVVLLHRFFPHTGGGAFTFFAWIENYFALALSGLFINLGMFTHIIVMWFSDIRVHVYGLFYGAPWYDLAALLAFMTTLVTTVNFVVSVEVNFYPKYRNHYSLYNDKGTIGDIKQSEKEMLDTLKTEIFYTSLKQLLFTAACISVGGYILDMLPLGFNEIMRGYFRTLCVGYGLYAVGNMVMLILLYFTDYKGALIATGTFAGLSTLLTLVSLRFPYIYYGYGFLVAALIFAIVTTLRLEYFTKRLPFFILSVQPLVYEERSGWLTRFGRYLEEKFEKGGKD